MVDAQIKHGVRWWADNEERFGQLAQHLSPIPPATGAIRGGPVGLHTRGQRAVECPEALWRVEHAKIYESCGERERERAPRVIQVIPGLIEQVSDMRKHLGLADDRAGFPARVAVDVDHRAVHVARVDDEQELVSLHRLHEPA